jgi:hypothetical protein
METKTQMTPATEAMLKLLVNSRNTVVANTAKKIINNESTVDYEAKYCGGFMKQVLNGNYEKALQLADSDNFKVLSQMSKKFEVKVTHEIKLEDVANLLVSAFEGGSNYWYNIKEVIKPKDEDLYRSFRENGELEYFPKYISYPLSEGGALVIEDSEDCQAPSLLNLVSIQVGLRLMATKHPEHFENFISDNADADTGDVFLQLCLFGEIVFG